MSKKKIRATSSLIVLWFAVVIIAVVIGGYIFLNSHYTEKEDDVMETHTTYVNQTTMVKVYENFSIEDYVVNRLQYDGKEVIVRGYLVHSIERPVAVPQHYYYIIDDYDNKIELFNLTEEQKELFPKQKKTKKAYDVTGIYVREFMSATMSVTNIEEYEDIKYTEVEKVIQIPQEVTVVNKKVVNMTLWESFFG
jgi:hypothetical protein